MTLAHIKKTGLAIAAAAVTLVFSSAAHADRLADIKARGSLICATLTSSEPLGYPDPATRQVVGFDVDMCAAVAKQLGVKLEHKGISVEARIPELTLGRVDLVVAALGYTKERAQQIDFTSIHYQTPIKLIAHSNAGLNKIEDLAEKRISANKGSTPELYARSMFPKATILTFQDTPAAFLALAQNKVQGLALSQPSGIRFVNESDGKYKFLDGALAWEPTGMGVKKDEPALLAAVNDALDKLEKSGETDALWSKWFGPKTKFNIPREKKLTPVSAFQ
ncbi:MULTISPECIES: ABC transporter substrate-binding protein [unclassified Herbaspirillum]|uniref:ABC transporter substrate-binding protein n=1 Tax=unclassified Herbaspirillum TaxID=2624150 RepID=UPI001173282C|nr:MULTISPECIES: ABC transporter substrate-binding protein [unclassified Herbaspirillum]MBB5390914.1 polar amino acid transport system substrate-binding protein [Herbaspirillum sp. SJZ102]TQK06438.1 amino acid ABC transporter substrate-binding protein (PAAT family) [Herbaspirillum sp. SJZ130]TQK12084.1 amino acid ABC transporter substrate-binding protein (PAAT family) [Herbaspirillum sp. SJZ106]